MKTAKKLDGMRESFIREMTRLAITHNAINLSQGFPDYDAPQEVIQAACDALHSGRNQYGITWGNLELREALAESLQKRFNLNYDPNQHITITCGVTEAMAIIFQALLDRDDEILIFEPFHEGYRAQIKFAGGSARFVTLDAPDYVLDPERVKAAITPKTKAIILNTPHNPTGRVFTREEMEGLAKVCQDYDLLVITDEIYDRIVYDGRQHIPMASLPGMAERTITVGGFGKTYAITGWRLGYICAYEPYSLAIRTVHDFTTICAPVPLQAAAAAALKLPESYYDKLIAEYTERRNLIMPELEALNFKCHMPEGAYYTLADFSAWNFEGDCDDFARWMPEHLGVAVVPGSCLYGTPGLGRKTVRFAFPKKLETLNAAVARLRAYHEKGS
ncbi:MAG: aminotransferase [Holophagaceae bacterium]|nr:aminotransferase [Holophagaceae bacterium]